MFRFAQHDKCVTSVNNKVSAYAVSMLGDVYKLVDTISLVGITNINTDIPNNFTLSQNYPNPFNPTTNIEFSVKTQSFINLTLYDVLGRELQVLVNEMMNPGTYSVQLNASQLASGVYFYKMSAENFLDVKKMIIQK